MPVGLFGEVRKTRSGAASPDPRRGAPGVEPEVVAAAAVQPVGARGPRDDRVHRVGRLEPQRRAAVPAERLQQLLEDLVGAVGRPDLPPGQPVPEIGGQVGPQLRRVPVRVAVQARRRRGGGRARSPRTRSGGRRVGVFVGVQPNGHVELRCAVRLEPGQVRARSGSGPRHAVVRRVLAVSGGTSRAKRARTAATCGGQVLGAAERGHVRQRGGERVPAALHHVDQPQERQHGQAGGVPGRAAGGQHVVRARQVVAERDRRERAGEDRARVAHPAGQLARVARPGSPGARAPRRRRPRGPRRCCR